MSTPSFDLLSARPRNYLINGDFNIAQRTGSPWGGGYGIDRWYFGATGSFNATTSQNSDVPTFAQAGFGFQSSMNFSCTVASTSPAAGDFAFLTQPIEGKFFAPLRNRKCTLSFWAKTSTLGTYGVSFRNGPASTHSYVSSFTVTQTATWVQYSVSVDFSQDSTGAYNYDNTVGLYVTFTFMIGTTYQSTTINAFANGNYIAPTSQTNLASTVGNYMRIAGVMLNEGGVAAPFSLMGANPQDELLIAQRYFRPMWMLPGTASSASNFIFGAPLNPPMRAAPTISATGPLNTQGNASYNAVQTAVAFGSLFPSANGIYGNATFQSGNISTNVSAFLGVPANNSNYITLDAEL